MSKSRLALAWHKGRSEKEVAELESLLLSNSILVQEILKILKDFEDEKDRKEIDPAQYDVPSWAYLQADRNGARRMLTRIRHLFQFN